MNMTIDKKNIYLGYVFYILNISSFVFMVYPKVRPGIVASVVMLIIVIMYLKYFPVILEGINIFFVLYFCICVFSGAFYILGFSSKSELFFYGISYNLLPMVMYLVGTIFAKKEYDKIMMNLIISNFSIILVGLALYYFEPMFYMKTIASNTLEILDMSNNYYRFPSYVGTLIVGNITSVSIPLIFMYREKLKKVYFFFFLIIFIVGSILSMQRSAFIATTFALSGCVLLSFKYNHSKGKIIKIGVGIVCTLIALLLIYNNIFTETQKVMFTMRGLSFNSAIGERINQWQTGIDIFSAYPFGTGLGSAGHKAVAAGILNTIPDGNYFRILAEVGLHGIIVFLLLNICALSKSIKNNKYIAIILIIYLFQAIGTNVFDLYYISFVYWFVLGFAANYSKISEQK